MAKIPPLVLLPPLIFAGLAGLLLGGLWRDNPDDLPSTFIGLPAPMLPEAALPGQELLTQEALAAGEVTLVNFWASWCPPCLAEHPKLLELAEQGIRIAGVNFGDQESNALDYLERHGDPFFAGAVDPDRRNSIEWGVSAPPETFIVDGDGTILFRYSGALVGTDYERRFLPALEAALGGRLPEGVDGQ